MPGIVPWAVVPNRYASLEHSILPAPQKRGLVLREVKCFSEVTQQASTRVRTEFMSICLQVLLVLSKVDHSGGIFIVVRN